MRLNMTLQDLLVCTNDPNAEDKLIQKRQRKHSLVWVIPSSILHLTMFKNIDTVSTSNPSAHMRMILAHQHSRCQVCLRLIDRLWFVVMVG